MEILNVFWKGGGGVELSETIINPIRLGDQEIEAMFHFRT
jgi:hypothetical protein